MNMLGTAIYNPAFKAVCAARATSQIIIQGDMAQVMGVEEPLNNLWTGSGFSGMKRLVKCFGSVIMD